MAAAENKPPTMKKSVTIAPEQAEAASYKKGRGKLRRISSSLMLVLEAITKPTDADDVLFNMLSDDGTTVSLRRFWGAINSTGIQESDPRLMEMRTHFLEKQIEMGYSADAEADIKLDRETFSHCIMHNITMLLKIFKKDLVVPEFTEFTDVIDEIFEQVKDLKGGQTSSFIPLLKNADPNKWAVSICTIDGQMHSVGDHTSRFTLQELCKPFNYAKAASERPKDVHKYVGQEPSGRESNALSLDTKKRPHNPMINTGGIIVSSMLGEGLQTADRFDSIYDTYIMAAGASQGEMYVGFNNPAYLSARNKADRDYALAYFMRENKCFPEKVQHDLEKNVEFYLQLCSTEVTSDSAAVMAATLANGGYCPITGCRVFQSEAVRNTLSLMYASGMYDYSGQFSFQVGLPAKSGKQGAVMLVIPNAMGICVWSPPVDEMNNSVKGVKFCQALVDHFNFHNYDNLQHHNSHKKDPREKKTRKTKQSLKKYILHALFGAADGDINTLRRFILEGMDMNQADYDGRTALHLAAANGHINIVKLLLEKCKVNPHPKDRWNYDPIDDARKNNKKEVVEYLEKYSEK